jgi:diguanylate cyclase (GGDEF)-like protein
VVELLRATDLVARVDDAIAVLLVHTPYSDATSIVERLRDQVESEAFHVVPGEPLTATLSLGLAEFPSDATSDGVLLAHARARLTEAWEGQRPSSGAS